MNHAVFGKNMENVRNERDIKLITNKARRNYLVSERNYYTTKTFSENLVAIEMKKIQIFMNKPVFLGLPILELSKIVLRLFKYDYVKPKYGENIKLCFIDTGSFIVYIKMKDIYLDISKDVEIRCDTSNYELDGPLLKR